MPQSGLLVRLVIALLLFAFPHIVLSQSELISGSRVLVGTLNYCSDAGTTDAYACNLDPPITVYTPGAFYSFRANTVNIGLATLSLNGLAAIPIRKVQGAITTNLGNNDIRVGQIVVVYYDGTNFQMTSQLGNAPTGGGGVADPGANGLMQRTALNVTAPYAGTACTNQVVAGLSSDGVGNCITIAAPYVDRSLGRMTFCEDDSVTTDVYSCTPDPVLTALTIGDPVTFTAASSNVGQPILTLGALSPVTIKKVTGSITTSLAANDIRAGQVVSVVYDGVFFQMTSPVGNAAAGSGTIQPGSVGQVGYYATSGTQLEPYGGLSLTPTAQVFAPAARVGIGTPSWTFLGAADTGLLAGAESSSFLINIAQTKTHQSNTAIAVQRHVRITSVTDSFETAGGVITDSATFSIGGPPTAGTNATLTNAYANWIRTTNVGAGTVNAWGMRIDAPTGASTINDAALFNGGVVITTGRFDATAALRTAPHKSGATPPATCTVADTFFDTDATAGQNIFGCTATNTWTQLSGGTGSSAFSALTSGTNTTAAMVIGTGGSLNATGTGQISATHLNGTAFAGTTNNLVLFGAANIPVDSAVAVSSLAVRNASNAWTTGTQDFSAATATLPVKTGTSAATPTSCIASKELYVKTDATAGQQLFVCNGAGNGFVLVGDGTGSAGHVIQNEGTPLTARAALNFTGTGVTCTDSSGTNSTICNVPGGGGAGAVETVFGRSGEVAAASGDYTAAQVTNAADITSDAQVWTGSPTWGTGETLTLCNTADCTTNYERLRVSWVAGVATIAAEKGGTGLTRTVAVAGADGGGIRTTTGGVGITGGTGGIGIINVQGGNLGLSIRGNNGTSTAAVNIALTGLISMTPVSGTAVGTRAVQTFAPTSGTATYIGLAISDTINQTGGANGITRGLHIAPTLTAAADYRALEIAGTSPQSILLGRNTTADTAGQTLSVIGGGATLAATDKDSGKLALKPGPSTGTGRGWVETYCLTPALVTGTTDNATYLCGVDGVSKPLIDGTAVDVASLVLATDTGNSVRLDYQIEVVNTTTHTVQVEDGYAICRAYNTNGTFGGNTCTQAFTQTIPVGTLATTFSITATNPAVVRILADTSLAASTGWPRVRFWAKVLGHQALAIP